MDQATSQNDVYVDAFVFRIKRKYRSHHGLHSGLGMVDSGGVGGWECM